MGLRFLSRMEPSQRVTPNQGHKYIGPNEWHRKYRDEELNLIPPQADTSAHRRITGEGTRTRKRWRWVLEKQIQWNVFRTIQG